MAVTNTHVTPLVYRYISGIILDHSIILIWILHLELQVITRISILDLPSRYVYRLVTLILPDVHIIGSMTANSPSPSKMYIMFRLVMVTGYLLLMVTPYWQEFIFLTANQITIHSCSNGSFLTR